MKIIMTKEIIGLGLLISIFHYLALKLFLYWTTDWFDVLMHFLGGFLIGLIMIAFIKRIHVNEEMPSKKLLFTAVILGVLVIGLTWELWEIFVGFTDVLKDQVDTMIDLVMDLIGGIVATLYYYFKYQE